MPKSTKIKFDPSISSEDICEKIQSLIESDRAEDLRAALELLDDHNPNIRQLAVSVLGEVEGSLGRIAARSALHDPSCIVRDVALTHLWANGLDMRALSKMLRNDEYWTVRATAADALGDTCFKSARRILEAAFHTERIAIVRAHIAMALTNFEDTAIKADIEAALSNERDDRVRIWFSATLYAMGDSKRLKDLIEILHGNNYAYIYITLYHLRQLIREEDRAIIQTELKLLKNIDVGEAIICRIDKILEEWNMTDK